MRKWKYVSNSNKCCYFVLTMIHFKIKPGIALLMVIALGFVSCKTETIDPKDIMRSSDITMTVKYQGCFGGGTQVVAIERSPNPRVVVHSYGNGLAGPDTIVPFTSEKEKAFAELLEIGLAESTGYGCTLRAIYRVETDVYKCQFEDNSCELHGYLVKLLR